MNKRTTTAMLALILALLGGCSNNTESDSDSINGIVTKINLEASTLTLQLDNNSTDTFVAGKGDLNVGYLQNRIQGTVVESSNQRRLEFIWPANPLTERIRQETSHHLRKDTVTRGNHAYRAVGEFIPQFALYNQNGQLITNQSLRGKYLVMNFIFTRCTEPHMCPASTARMARLQRTLQKHQIDTVELASITFDPQHDTPGILNQYAADRDIDTSNFHFLTAPKDPTNWPSTIHDLMKQFGIMTMQEDGTINHNMATLLIDPKGKIIMRKEGSRWNERDFVDKIKAINS